MDLILMYILLFFAYSFIGWCIEVTLIFFESHKFVNRGFNFGPYCPVYGTGALIITLTMKVINLVESGYGTTFVVSLIICAIVEYGAGYLLEKIYHARWWDYSTKPMNLNGRIWIGNSILFGIGGLAIMKVINPFLLRLYGLLMPSVWDIIAIILLVIFVIDASFSNVIMKVIKDKVVMSEADNTEDVKEEIKAMLLNKSIFYKRFADAYPRVIYTTERITRRIEAIKAETERLKAEAEQRIDMMGEKFEEKKEQLANAYETTGSIKTSIIEKQNELITILMADNNCSKEALDLKAQIDEKVEQLKKRQLPHLHH